MKYNKKIITSTLTMALHAYNFITREKGKIYGRRFTKQSSLSQNNSIKQKTD